VRDLVSDQSLTVASLWIVRAVAEHHILADREGSGAERACGRIGIASGVDADVVELDSEGSFEL
jgi:hypothetical protein